tara:strand:- start:198 stop:422 length:225 start_codon:yes stop_codon:yes gene_type:complete
MSENLDLINIIEVKKIREILTDHPDLLTIFELLVKTSNIKINDERAVRTMPIEKYVEPDLSSDSEDDILLSNEY